MYFLRLRSFELQKSRSHPEKAATVFLLPFDDPRQLEIKNCHGAFIEDIVLVPIEYTNKLLTHHGRNGKISVVHFFGQPIDLPTSVTENNSLRNGKSFV